MPCEHQGQRTVQRRCFNCWSRDSLAALGRNSKAADISGQPVEGTMPEQAVACGACILELTYPEGLKPLERTYAGAGGKCEEEVAE